MNMIVCHCDRPKGRLYFYYDQAWSIGVHCLLGSSHSILVLDYFTRLQPVYQKLSFIAIPTFLFCYLALCVTVVHVSS